MTWFEDQIILYIEHVIVGLLVKAITYAENYTDESDKNDK